MMNFTTWLLVVPMGFLLLMGAAVFLVVLSASRSTRTAVAGWCSQMAPLGAGVLLTLLLLGRSDPTRDNPPPLPPEAAPEYSVETQSLEAATPTSGDFAVVPDVSERLSVHTPPVANFAMGPVLVVAIVLVLVIVQLIRWATPRWPHAAVAVPALFVAVALAGGIGLSFVGHPQSMPPPQMATRVVVERAPPAVTRVPEATIPVAAMRTGSSGEAEEATRSSHVAVETPSTPRSTEPSRITQFQGESNVGVRLDERPAWTHETPVVAAGTDAEQFVLVSGRFADLDGAEAELLSQLRPRLAAYLARGGVDVSPEELTLDEIRHAAIRTRRLHEQFDVEVGEFTPSVYRETWEISLRPAARTTLAAAHQLALRDDRLWKLGVGFGLLTLLFGACAGGLRIDDATQGRYRGRMAAVAIASTAAAATGFLRVLRG